MDVTTFESEFARARGHDANADGRGGGVESRRRGGLGLCWHESELLQQAKIVEPSPPFGDLAVGNAEDVDPA